MLLEFHQLDELEIQTLIHNRKYPTKVTDYLKDKDSNNYDFFCCECNHIHGGIDHEDSKEYPTEPCGFGMKKTPCGCTRFVPKEFWFRIEITNLDIFKFENPDLIFDSGEFWLEFKNWIKNHG